jgi:hypothetical protein
MASPLSALHIKASDSCKIQVLTMRLWALHAVQVPRAIRALEPRVQVLRFWPAVQARAQVPEFLWLSFLLSGLRFVYPRLPFFYGLNLAAYH